MKTLLFDAGNTRLKWALCEKGQLSQQGSLRYKWPTLTAQLDGAFNKLLSEAGPLNGVTMCNVAGHKLAAVLQAILQEKMSSSLAESRAHGHEQLKESAPLTINNVIAQSNAYGVRCAYENPAQLGADRWAALVAARHHIAGSSCIIDCGTALTVDVLSAEGRHAGGIIIPGMEMMMSELVENTDGVFASEQPDLSPLEVTDTAGAVQAGVIAAMRGAVHQVLQYCRDEFGDAPDCVLTGGNAQRLLPGLPGNTVVEPDWVLKGLAVIATADQ